MAKIQVPEGMLKAALDAKQMPHRREYEETVRPAIEAALQWLSEHPIVPTDEQVLEMYPHYASISEIQETCREWQRRMFLAEPEIPEEAPFPLTGEFEESGMWKELAQRVIDGGDIAKNDPQQALKQLQMCLRQVERLAAFRRGQRSKG